MNSFIFLTTSFFSTLACSLASSPTSSSSSSSSSTFTFTSAFPPRSGISSSKSTFTAPAVSSPLSPTPSSLRYIFYLIFKEGMDTTAIYLVDLPPISVQQSFMYYVMRAFLSCESEGMKKNPPVWVPAFVIKFSKLASWLLLNPIEKNCDSSTSLILIFSFISSIPEIAAQRLSARPSVKKSTYSSLVMIPFFLRLRSTLKICSYTAEKLVDPPAVSFWIVFRISTIDLHSVNVADPLQNIVYTSSQKFSQNTFSPTSMELRFKDSKQAPDIEPLLSRQRTRHRESLGVVGNDSELRGGILRSSVQAAVISFESGSSWIAKQRAQSSKEASFIIFKEGIMGINKYSSPPIRINLDLSKSALENRTHRIKKKTTPRKFCSMIVFQQQMKSKFFKGYCALLLLLLLHIRAQTSVQIMQDNLVKVVQKYMGVTPIMDYVVHYDERVQICLDDYFRGQNPNYSIDISPPTEPNTLIKIQEFLDLMTSQSFGNGKAVAGYVGYCQQLNRHILYIYTEQGFLLAYQIQIGLVAKQTPHIIEQVSPIPLHVECPNFQGMQIECTTFYSEVNNYLLMGCKNQKSEPVLVRITINVPYRNIYVNSCIVFQTNKDTQNIYIKYVSPNNDFVVIEVEQVDGTVSDVRDFYIAIDQDNYERLHHSKLVDSVRLAELSSTFLGSSLAQPLNIQGFAKVNQLLLAFNEMGELYEIRLRQVEGYLQALQPLKDSIRRIQKYKIKGVMQASVWDEAPNRILIQGTSTDDGTQSVIELIVSESDMSAPIGNTIYVNLNPLDTFYLNQRGASMENQNYLIQEIYEDEEKLLLRIFQKDLPFYSMPISDYFITYRGFVSALILDYYSNLIVIVQDQQFKIFTINGNTLQLGGDDLSSIYNQTLFNNTVESMTQLDAISSQEYSVFLSEEPGFLSEKISSYNQTFRVKFIDPLSTQIYQIKPFLISTFEVGRPSIILLKDPFFIGPNVTLDLKMGDNSNLPDSYMAGVQANLLPIVYQSDHSIVNPSDLAIDSRCKNYTLFVAQINLREYVCHLCFQKFKIHLFMALYDTTLHGFDIQLEFSMHPFQILDLNYDADQKIIVALTKLTQFQTQQFIHVLKIIVSEHGNSLEWMGKSNILPYPVRPPTHSTPSTFYKPQQQILLVITEKEKWILVYSIDLDLNPSILFVTQQLNPSLFQPSRDYGSIWRIHFLPFHFLLFAYTKDLVVARGDPFTQSNGTFTFTQKFKENTYDKIEAKNGFVMLYNLTDIEQYNFADPFLPTFVRCLKIPYPNYELYLDQIGEVITTNDLANSIIGIWRNTQIEDKYYIACFKTDTQMSHNSLYFIREMRLSDELKMKLKNRIPLIMFGYELFGGNNYVFLNIGNAVLPYHIYFHQAVELRTPSVEIDSKIPLNFTISTPWNCTRVKEGTPCEYKLSLIGQMSGAVIQANRNTDLKNQVILSSPSYNPRVIMDPYFDGFNLRFSVSKILSDPHHLQAPLLKAPQFLNKLVLPTFEQTANITNQFFIKKPFMNMAVLATVDSLRSVSFQELEYESRDNKIIFTTLLSITIPDLDFVDQILEIDRPTTSGKPAATFWIVYGKMNGFRRIVLYNVTALYHDNSNYIDFNTEAINNFRLTQSIYPWYQPVKWAFSESHQYFVITYDYGNPYDEPIILFKTDFDNGKIIQLGIINAIRLRLDVFSAASFYIHSFFPILVAGGTGPYITIVNLETQEYMYSVSLIDLDPVFASLDSVNVQWLDQIDGDHFYAYVQFLGLVEMRLSIYSPKDDYDKMSNPQITLVGITYEPGDIVYQNGLETPFTSQENLRACLFQHTPNSGNTTYSIKLVNSYEPTRSRIFYEFKLPQSFLCYKPQFFSPFSLENRSNNPGKIFISVICDGRVLQYQLWQFSFLELDLSFINNIDPTQFPLTQELQIRASNINDVEGVTLDFEVSVLTSGQQLSDGDIGGLAVIILVLIVIFMLLGWVIRRQRKPKKPSMEDLKLTFAESSESTIALETEIIPQESEERRESVKYEVSEEASKEISTGIRFASDEF